MSRRIRIASLAVALLAASTLPTPAGTEEVVYPQGFETGFLRYATRDKPDRKTVRFFYVNRDAFQAAQPGAALPYGTVLVMEDHKARLGADQVPILDAEGALIPTDEVSNVFVMEKREGWGADYPDAVRNGEWEYAWFASDGQRRADKTMDRCFECHKARADADFTFITMDALERLNRQ